MILSHKDDTSILEWKKVVLEIIFLHFPFKTLSRIRSGSMWETEPRIIWGSFEAIWGPLWGRSSDGS